MTEIVLAHDYLVQTGGAERVVPTWASGFGARSVTILAHRPESTFEVFASLEVKASLPPAFAGHVERLLPALPAIAERTTVRGGDVALASSSGWAHRFRYETPHVVYVHSPARWLYAADDTAYGSVGCGEPGSRPARRCCAAATVRRWPAPMRSSPTRR